MISPTIRTPLWRELKRSLPSRVSPPDAAKAVLRRLEVMTPPVDVKTIAVRLGIDVYERSLGYAGEVTVTGDHAVIVVSRLENERRKRFTIAHEIGHIMLHDVQHAHRDTSFGGGDPREVEANRFAASLMMPFSMLENYVVRGRIDLGALARRFDVSEAAMRIRVSDLLGVAVDEI